MARAAMSHDEASDKEAIRQRMWTRLEESGASPHGARGRIPDFKGTGRAADRLARLSQWQAARVIKANPDHAQLPVRRRALHGGKLVFMAVPRLASLKPFFMLDPEKLQEAGISLDEVAAHQRAAELVPQVSVAEMSPVDLIVCGTVAVNRQGVRIGKGAGYSDIEVGLLTEAGLISESTTIVTTVHSVQVVDEDLPSAEHDFTVDYIVTPEEVIRCGRRRRPMGLSWDKITPEMMVAIPVLQTTAPER